MRKLRFLGKLRLLILFAVAFTPCSVSAQELFLDHQRGTCSQLTKFVDLQGVADVTGERNMG